MKTDNSNIGKIEIVGLVGSSHGDRPARCGTIIATTAGRSARLERIMGMEPNKDDAVGAFLYQLRFYAAGIRVNVDLVDSGKVDHYHGHEAYHLDVAGSLLNSFRPVKDRFSASAVNMVGDALSEVAGLLAQTSTSAWHDAAKILDNLHGRLQFARKPSIRVADDGPAAKNNGAKNCTSKTQRGRAGRTRTAESQKVDEMILTLHDEGRKACEIASILNNIQKVRNANGRLFRVPAVRKRLSLAKKRHAQVNANTK